LISEKKLEEAREKIDVLIHNTAERIKKGSARTGAEAKEEEEEASLLEVNNAIQLCGLDTPGVIEALGYTIVWEGLDMEKSRVIRAK
jgi:hypothetical protein